MSKFVVRELVQARKGACPILLKFVMSFTKGPRLSSQRILSKFAKEFLMTATNSCCAQQSSQEAGDKRMCACHYKETERAEKLQADVKKRLNRAIGQLNGVKNMIDDNRYCGDVLTQLAAAESAVHSAAELILRDHLETCVKDRIQRGDDEVIEEAMRLIKKFAHS